MKRKIFLLPLVEEETIASTYSHTSFDRWENWNLEIKWCAQIINEAAMEQGLLVPWHSEEF